MKIVSMSADGGSEYNSGHWQTAIPCGALIRGGHDVRIPHINQWLYNTEEIRRIVADADLILIQRVLVEESANMARQWKERGKAIAVTFDDAYQLLKVEDGNQASKFWVEGKVEISHPMGEAYEKHLEIHPLEQFRNAMRYINAGIVPSRILAEDWTPYCKMFYIPNYIDSPRYLKAKRDVRPDPNWITIGWGGSLSHLPSFKKSGVMEALRRVILKRDNVRFLLAGDKRVYDLLPLTESKKVYQQYVHYLDWPKVLARYDIGIAPLFSRYDSSRSSIKSEEYTIMGIPFVATGCPTYQDWIDEGVGLFVDDDGDEKHADKRADEWELKLLDVIDNLEFHRKKMADAFEFGMSYDVDQNVGNIIKVYEQVIAS